MAWTKARKAKFQETMKLKKAKWEMRERAKDLAHNVQTNTASPAPYVRPKVNHVHIILPLGMSIHITEE